MRRIAGGVLLGVAALFVLAAMAGSAGQSNHAAATGGALLLGGPAAGLGAWFAFVPRRRRRASARPRWHALAAIVMGVLGLSAAALAGAVGQGAVALLLLTLPAAGALWWTATHLTDAPPRPAVVELPGRGTEPALLYAIPRSKQVTLAAAALVGLIGCGAAAAVLRAGGGWAWLPLALGAVGCLGAGVVWLGPPDAESGLALSRSGVSFRQRGRVVLVPWDALLAASASVRRGPRGTRTRSLDLHLADLRDIRGAGPRLPLPWGRPAAADPQVSFAGWLFDTDARRIADHIELLLEEPAMRAEDPALVGDADRLP